jgi:2-methylcitrate dehydratase PrpD
MTTAGTTTVSAERAATATLAERLAAFACEVRDAGTPDEVRASVRQRVLDIVGLCLAAGDLPTSRSALAFVSEQGGRGQAHAIGLAEPAPAAWAAFANGVLAHSLDYDDTHLPSVLHPSASVVPAALAAAEQSGASGREVVSAIAVGLEVCVRLGMAGYDAQTRNSTFFEHGQHATSICGAMGAAVSAAMLLGLDRKGVLDTIGVTGSMAAGIIEANRTGGTVKRLHCGWAAHAALSAASLVRHGFTGPPTVLEGRFGFFEAFLHGRYDATAVVDGLGTSWATPEIFFKPYPANHFTHAAIDAAYALGQQGLRPEQVAAVRLLAAAPVIRTIGEPIAEKRTPTTGYQAQFSGPFAVATGLLTGAAGTRPGRADFTDELAREPLRRELMAKVTVAANDECSAIFPFEFPAIVEVDTVDGRTLVSKVLTNLGGPRRPLSDEDLLAKFRDNAAGVAAADLTEIEQGILGLDELPQIRSLLATAARAKPVRTRP